MEPSALHNLAALYLQQDDFAYFALGLAHAAASLEAAVDLAAAYSGEDQLAPAGSGEEAAFFLLGLLSFARRYRLLLSRLASQAQSAPALPASPTPSPARLEIRELLR
jgi:hypothetical protein